MKYFNNNYVKYLIFFYFLYLFFSSVCTASYLSEIEINLDRVSHKDLTKLPFISIDPSEARLIDDGICVQRNFCEEMETSSYRCYVAIADPTYKLGVENSEIQKILKSVFVPQPRKRLSFLFSEEVSSQLSLSPRVNREAIIIDFLISAEGELEGSIGIYRATIQSYGQFSYKQLTRFIGKKNRENEKFEIISKAATALRNRYKKPFKKHSIEAGEAVIEEFMVFSNQIVTQYMKNEELMDIFKLSYLHPLSSFKNKKGKSNNKRRSSPRFQMTSPLRRPYDLALHIALFEKEGINLIRSLQSNRYNLSKDFCPFEKRRKIKRQIYFKERTHLNTKQKRRLFAEQDLRDFALEIGAWVPLKTDLEILVTSLPEFEEKDVRLEKEIFLFLPSSNPFWILRDK